MVLERSREKFTLSKRRYLLKLDSANLLIEHKKNCILISVFKVEKTAQKLYLK